MNDLLTLERTALRELVEAKQRQIEGIAQAEYQKRELENERWRSSKEGRAQIQAVEAQRAELQKAAERIVRDVLRLAQEAEETFAAMQTNDQAYKTATRTNTFRSLASAAEFRAFTFVRNSLEKIIRSIGVYRR